MSQPLLSGETPPMFADSAAEPGRPDSPEAEICARVLLMESPEEIAEALKPVQNWDAMPPVLYPHVLRIGAALPASFYRQKSEQFADIAAALPRYDPRFPYTVAAYGLALTPETPAELTWLFDLTAAALRVGDPADGDLLQALCAQFAYLGADVLHNFYNPDLLNEQDITALPGLHAFAWCYLQAREADGQGDPAEAVRLLRRGLQIAPGMKWAADYEFRRMRLAASPELRAMAERLRDKVAALRDANAPGLDDLLASPAYQKLQPLIARLETTESR